MQQPNNFVIIDDSDSASNNESDSDSEILVIDENEMLLKDLTKPQVIAMFDGFSVPPPHWNVDTIYPIGLDEAVRHQDCLSTNTIIQDSLIPNAGKGLYTVIPVPTSYEYPYSGVLRLKYAGHESDEDVFYGTMKHRSVETLFQPFLHLGITMFVVGSYNSAATYMNDLDHGLNEPPSRTSNNCMIVANPHGDVNVMTVRSFKDWLKQIPVRIEAITDIPASSELVTSYQYRCTIDDMDDDSSSNNDHDSDSDYQP
jgi:hypothetical protein